MTTTDLRAVLAEMEEASGNEFSAQRDLPRLTAAVRAVLGIVDEWGVEADARYGTNRIAKGTAARVLRDALAAALDPAPPDQAES